MPSWKTRWVLAALAAAAAFAPGCGHVPEYLVVGLEAGADLTPGGQCPRDDVGDTLRPEDVAVLIEGECQGIVGEVIPLTAGSFEVSVDVVGARMQVVELKLTTVENPKVVTIQFAEGE